MSNLVLETLAALRPKFTVAKDFEAACKQVQKVEDEFLAVLREKMPEYMAWGGGAAVGREGGRTLRWPGGMVRGTPPLSALPPPITP